MGETTGEVRSRGEFDRSRVERSEAAPKGAPLRGEDVGESSEEVTQIRSGIQKTRSNLSDTIDALQDKLDPSRIAEQVKDQIRDKAVEAYDTAKEAVKEATIGKAGKIVSSVSEAVTDVTGRAGTVVSESGSTVVQYIRDNPVPLTLLGIGLGMLAFNKRNSGPSSNRTVEAYAVDHPTTAESPSRVAETTRGLSSSVAEGARSVTGQTVDAVSSAASSVRDAVGSATDGARHQFQGASSQTRQGAKATTRWFQNTMEENPMVLGMGVLAAGAVVGLTLPTTRIEGDYMGEARDQLVDQAKSVAQEAVGKVQHVAEEAGNTAKDAARKEGLTGS